MTERVDEATCVIKAKASRVYQALLDPAILSRWLPPDGATIEIQRFKPREGGKFRFVLTFAEPTGKSSKREDVVSGHFVRLAPDQEVAQAITFDTEDAQFGGEMRMCWRLSESSSGTSVSVSAENVPHGISRSEHQKGMMSSLEHLKLLLERQT